jgi:2-amino-4-hydroxy-6-hydroxymethyldihydropteridine diphosphokinase
VALTTDLDAAALAAACRQIETDLGRDRAGEIPWGPAPIDIDVIAIGDEGRMEAVAGSLDRRAFVLVPLAEIAPATVVDGRSIGDHARATGAPASNVSTGLHPRTPDKSRFSRKINVLAPCGC